MAVQTRRYTLEEFDRMVHLPENAERRLEFIGGEIVSKASDHYLREVTVRISFRFSMFLFKRGAGGYTTSAYDGGYQIASERYIPDVAFISQGQQPEPSHHQYYPNSPDLAVEVISPTQVPRLIRLKMAHYLAAGTVVWLVNTEHEYIEVYTPGQPPQLLNLSETLDGGAVLPGFSMAVKDIFPTPPD